MKLGIYLFETVFSNKGQSNDIETGDLNQVDCPLSNHDCFRNAIVIHTAQLLSGVMHPSFTVGCSVDFAF